MLTLIVLEIIRAITIWPHHQEFDFQVFQSKDEMEKVWVADGGDKKDLPKVNFETETVIAAFAGEQKTEGFGIKIEKVVEVRGQNSVVKVIYSRSIPPRDSNPKAVLNYPNHVIVIKKAAEVQIVDKESDDGQYLMDARNYQK